MTLNVPGLRVRERVLAPAGSTFMWNGSMYLVTGTLYGKQGSGWVPAQTYGQGPAWLPKGTITAKLTNPNALTEMCIDDAFPHRIGPRGKFEEGGPFTKIRLDTSGHSLIQGLGTYDSYNTYSITGMGYVKTRYVGGYLVANMPQAPKFNGEAFAYTDRAKLLASNFLIADVGNEWGPQAWARSAPKIQMADGFVFLSESRELPSMLMDQSKRFHEEWKFLSNKVAPASLRSKGTIPWRMQPKQVADEYLTQQFGWAPFLRDLDKFGKAYFNRDDYMRRMSQGNDQWQHVRRDLLEDYQVSNQVSGNYTWQLLPNNHWDQFGNLRPGFVPTYNYHEEKFTVVTSSGVFKWYKPEFDELDKDYSSLMNKVYREMAMYGVRVNPSNIWRAIPWTWLVDWGLNVGRNIDRLTEYVEDGVVCKYLYVMHHTITQHVLNVTYPAMRGDVSMRFTNVIDVKLRRAVDSPFGFGSPWSTLSPWRLSILAALGISKPSRVGYH